jgi:hypothetical protein
MDTARLEDMVGGWFVGGFAPTALETQNCEVAVKHYAAGVTEELHHHRVATEVTLILSGRVRMVGKEWSAGDIIVLHPGEATDFEALTDVVNVVVKTPGALNDKYLGELEPQA